MVAFIQDDEVVEALAADGTDHPFGVGIDSHSLKW